MTSIVQEAYKWSSDFLATFSSWLRGPKMNDLGSVTGKLLELPGWKVKHFSTEQNWTNPEAVLQDLSETSMPEVGNLRPGDQTWPNAFFGLQSIHNNFPKSQISELSSFIADKRFKPS